MAHAKNIMVSCLFERPSSRMFLQQKNQFLMSPAIVMPLQQRKRVGVKSKPFVKSPIAAISGDVFKANSIATPIIPVVAEKAFKDKLMVRAVVTVRNKNKVDFKETLVKHWDAITEKIGRNVVLELISTETDPKTKEPKRSKEAVLKDWSKKTNVKAKRVHYTAEFIVDSDFGVPGAIIVTNKHQQEFFLENITIENFACGPIHFPCNSWVQSNKDHPGKRIFFSNKSYLPCETPKGLEALREEELKNLRGDGTGVRKLSDRIYDFDIYNDMGNPDKVVEFNRPNLGGEKFPYPRRCRTGRAPMDTDVTAESRIEKPNPVYVPRDEQFEESKQNALSAGRLKGFLHNLLPSLKASISADKHDFGSFSDIDILYEEDLLPKLGIQDEIWRKLPLPIVVTKLLESSKGLLRFDTPKIVSKDKFAWLRDDGFARQAVAGINPVNIERLKYFPPKSNLDPEIYGPQESSIREEHIVGQLNGMSVQQAIDENKLYMVDHHDAYLPFLERINALDGRKSYATRTIFFLTPVGTLKPIAIELCLPPTVLGSRTNRVITPPDDATSNWIWQLAKAHVCSNDAGVHQLINHLLRTHFCLEPFILATHRQLSAMHPIYKLLDPHMRYTLQANALARQNLITVIESCYTPGKYCVEISTTAYKNWRFDLEGLPADLIRRGMVVPDPTQPHGLKLLMEDYPYAQDGLLIWFAVENWVRAYVNHYYVDATMICNDKELQAWYAECINVGHADLSGADGWPNLDDSDNLVLVLTTLIWLASAQHAALNFGQYPYGGYVPNKPTLMRKLIPEETDPEYESFLADPQKYFLSALPSLLQATKFMTIVDIASTHSPDEEYLGERQQLSTWSDDAVVVEAFSKFSADIRRIEKEIDRRNKDPNLRNRYGAGVLPYELLAPSSEPGVTCRGVPNSVTT